jgi:F420H(2)-dependent quinone reductase
MRASSVMTTVNSSPVCGVPVALSDFARRHPGAARRLTAAHAAVVRGSRGYLAVRWFGSPVLLLETIGRRTGRARSTALVYLPDGEDLVVVAANAGSTIDGVPRGARATGREMTAACLSSAE